MTLAYLDEVADERLAGGKAFNCARLRRAGFAVPDGIVVLAGATAADIQSIARAPFFDRFSSSALFAVRSSAIGEDSVDQSFAGIHQTLLDGKRGDIAGAVESCLASARSPRALEYRRARKLPVDSIQMAVLVQPMIRPIAAGVAFRINPVSGAAGEVVINSSWGVGEQLVGGHVDPDEFIVSKSSRELIWSRVGEKAARPATAEAVALQESMEGRGGLPRHRAAAHHAAVALQQSMEGRGFSPGQSNGASLTPIQLRELADVLVRIEQHYGSPQDIEWCHDGEAFWIVQSRPVTTKPAAANDIEWTRANLAEVLPDLTSPQALAAFEPLLKTAQREYMGALFGPEDELGPVVKTFNGRLYFNLTQMRHVSKLAMRAPAELLKSMGHPDAIHPEDQVAGRPTIGAAVKALPTLARLISRHLRAERLFRRQAVRAREALDRLRAIDVRSLPDDTIAREIESWLDDAPETMQVVFLFAGVMIWESAVRNLCRKAGFSYEQLVFPQMAVGERSVSAQQAFDLTALADTARDEPEVRDLIVDHDTTLDAIRRELAGTRFLAGLEKFLDDYGHRGRFETDWALPRYSEDIRPLLFAIRSHLESSSRSEVADLDQKLRKASAESWAAFEATLSPLRRLLVLPRVRLGVRKIKQYYVWRERVRSDMIKVLAAMRVWHLALADRFVERGWIEHRADYFLLHTGEVVSAVRGHITPADVHRIVSTREAEQSRYRAIRMPLLMRESELPHLIRTAGISTRAPEAGELTGQPVSVGVVEAEVVVVRDPADFERMKRGAILVAPATDPSWTPLFTLASGVIVEVGGVLSHASTIAREYGLPAIANVKDATRILRTGGRIRLDAVNGIITRKSASTF